MGRWLLLVHKVPREPTSGRVYVWRKLKQLGAVLLQDAVWVLPANARTEEHFQWLAAEVRELGGEASVWESHAVGRDQDERLTRAFQAQVEPAYREILSELKQKKADLQALARRYQQVHAQDYFPSELSRRVRQALLKARGEQP